MFFVKQTKFREFALLREKNEHYHWAESDYNLFPTFLTPKKCFK